MGFSIYTSPSDALLVCFLMKSRALAAVILVALVLLGCPNTLVKSECAEAQTQVATVLTDCLDNN